MDYENERVLKLMFPGGVPGKRQQFVLTNLQDNPDFIDFLLKLGTYKVDQIKKDQQRLGDEHKAIVEQTQDLAITNYKTFIQTSECSREIFSKFMATEKRVDSLVENLPDFSKKCTQFVKKSNEINAARRLNTLTLKKNAQLLEILELPQLMDTCIREEQYEDALESAAYVQRLGVKHENIPIIQGIVRSIDDSWSTMLKQLLAQLKTDLQLPKCLQVVGYLRRMQAFSNSELKLKFLVARDAWFRSIIDAIPTDDPQLHIIKTIELSRINLFNIITQYKAIFTSDDDKTSSTDLLKTDSSKLFYNWIHQKIDDFLVTLEIDLTKGVSSMDTVLGQCMYFGLSFSRVGADFRGLMAPIFIKVISQNFKTAMQNVTRQFEIDMDGFTLINKFSSGLSRAKNSTGENDVSFPPETLLDFYPLAIYCNGILKIFNELRLCAPIAVASDVTIMIQSSLESVSRCILSFYRQEQQAFTANERENFIKLCTCFAYDLIPYLQNVIHTIFPSVTLSTHLGITNLALQKEGLTYLKTKNILEPLKNLLPDKIDTSMLQRQEEKLEDSTILVN